MIGQDTIEQVRLATDIVQIVSEYVRLKKKGKYFWAVCPFHVEKTPSFKVSADNQLFYCFGCGKGGNVFTFLMEHEKMSFVDAVRHLAHKANIQIRETVSDYKREQIERLNYAHMVAVQYFRDMLFEPKYEVVLRDYLQTKRGLTLESIDQFQLGLAGESWDGFIKHAATKDIKPEELEMAGLVLKSEKTGGYFDRFRQRLMIPIFNLSQKPIAFGGRTLKKGEPAKYMNSPETPLYHKSSVLYGLNSARDYIRESGTVLVVEGYFDVISLWQVGIKNVVASSGTAFTQQQGRLLVRFAEEVFLFFDADSAGHSAALRSVDSLYDAGLEVKVVVAPQDEDPDSIAQEHGADEIIQLQQKALSYIPYRTRHADLDGAGIIAREKLVKELASLASRIADPTRRTLFIQEAAETLGVEPTLFKVAGAMPNQGVGGHDVRLPRFDSTEYELLSVLLNYHGSFEKVLDKICADDFEAPQLGRLYAAIETQYERDGAVNAGRLSESFSDSEMISLVSELATKEWHYESVDVELVERIKDFEARNKKRIRARLKEDLASAEAADDQKQADNIIDKLKHLR